MRTDQPYRIVLGKGGEGPSRPDTGQRKIAAARLDSPTIEPRVIIRALRKTAGADTLIQQIPNLGKAAIWRPVAQFTVCQKTGTATWLDIWDSDHFDDFTDMQRCITDCRAWFSDQGYTFWDSPQTRTGRINCYFRAPVTGNYVCNAQLQSYGGPAQVECVIDSFSFGLLPFNGPINQPHPCALSAGYHSFRIRQMSGSFFFISLTVWQV